MKEIDFSIIFNSRNRVDMLTKMLECIQTTTSNLDRLEVLVNFDNDDKDSLSAFEDLISKFNFLTCLVNKREINIHFNVNRMAFMSRGKYIWALGDDCHIMTKDWDKIAFDKFKTASEKYPDEILLGAVNSTSIDKVLQFGWYCDAPILTRAGMNALGYLIHPHFISAGADVATWIIYGSANRIIDMRDILFDHVTHNSIQALQKKDQTQIEYLDRQMSRQTFNPFTYDYSKDIAIIKELTVEKGTNSL